MKRNEENTSQRGGLSKVGDGGLKHTQNHVCTVKSWSSFVQQPHGYEKKIASTTLKKTSFRNCASVLVKEIVHVIIFTKMEARFVLLSQLACLLPALGLGLAGSRLLGMISFFGLRVIDFTLPLHLKGPSTSYTHPSLNISVWLVYDQSLVMRLIILLYQMMLSD